MTFIKEIPFFGKKWDEGALTDAVVNAIGLMLRDKRLQLREE